MFLILEIKLQLPGSLHCEALNLELIWMISDYPED